MSMMPADLDTSITDTTTYDRAVAHCRERKVLLPTFAELADPTTMPPAIAGALAGVDPDAAHPANLFRVHWWNDATRRGRAALPEHVVLPESLTGVKSPIVVAFGDRFPMIGAHKVLPAYACLVPRLVSGRFDPTRHRAVWPSTGNYCRGGVAISRIMGCRGVAVLPAGMSAERFEWLGRWVSDPADVVRTPGTESNVREIYEKCDELARDPGNVILNQFSEYGNHLAHFSCTGRALEAVHGAVAKRHPGLRAAAFVSATGSAGTIAAGDWLKDRFGTRIVAAEPVECPTLLENGFGEHNIQGIGDKHVPLIHNVMNTDLVVAVSDRATDQLGLLASTKAGLEFLRGRGVPEPVLGGLASFGLSSWCNVLGAIKTAKALDLGPDEAVYTVATDGARLYPSEFERVAARDFPAGFDERSAGEAFARWVLAADADHTLELTAEDRRRVFNLGYYTWVEQRGTSLEHFAARREQGFWRGLRDALPRWDEQIREFNARTGVRPA